jgi:hypothetical protein
LNHAVALGRERRGFDSPVVAGRSAVNQAELLEPGERPAGLRVVLAEQVGELQHPDRATHADGDQVLGQVRIECHARTAQQQCTEARARGSPEHLQPDVVVVVVSHPVHYARIFR